MNTELNNVSIKINEDLWLSRATELYNIQQKRKELEKSEAVLASELKQMQQLKPMSFGGIRYSFEERVGTINYSSIPELQAVDLEWYRNAPIRVWKLTIEQVGLLKI